MKIPFSFFQKKIKEEVYSTRRSKESSNQHRSIVKHHDRSGISFKYDSAFVSRTFAEVNFFDISSEHPIENNVKTRKREGFFFKCMPLGAFIWGHITTNKCK